MIPQKIQAKADSLLSAYLNGAPCARRGTGQAYLTIEVGYRYRLMCRTPADRNRRDAWELLTHERYNKLSRKAHQ